MDKVKRITLSYRKDAAGGDVRDTPRVSDENALKSTQHLVLLIHGYNNDAKAAAEAYEGFHARQRDLDEDARYGIGRTFVEVYWPGDHANKVRSIFFYMKSIERAIKTAGLLADYLADHVAAHCRIDIVAHSMGCRLALELLLALSGRSSAPRVGRIVFMAGAVPTFMLEQQNPPRRLRAAYDVLCEGAHSLYSGSDWVLALAFPAGQSLAGGEEGLVCTALGHTLWVDTTVPLNLGQIENQHSGHSDYWGWNTEPKPLRRATKAAIEVRSYLQFPSTGSRTISDRPLLERSAVEVRELAEERERVEREILKWAE